MMMGWGKKCLILFSILFDFCSFFSGDSSCIFYSKCPNHTQRNLTHNTLSFRSFDIDIAVVAVAVVVVFFVVVVVVVVIVVVLCCCCLMVVVVVVFSTFFRSIPFSQGSTFFFSASSTRLSVRNRPKHRCRRCAHYTPHQYQILCTGISYTSKLCCACVCAKRKFWC